MSTANVYTAAGKDLKEIFVTSVEDSMVIIMNNVCCLIIMLIITILLQLYVPETVSKLRLVHSETRVVYE